MATSFYYKPILILAYNFPATSQGTVNTLGLSQTMIYLSVNCLFIVKTKLDKKNPKL